MIQTTAATLFRRDGDTLTFGDLKVGNRAQAEGNAPGRRLDPRVPGFARRRLAPEHPLTRSGLYGFAGAGGEDSSSAGWRRKRTVTQASSRRAGREARGIAPLLHPRRGARGSRGPRRRPVHRHEHVAQGDPGPLGDGLLFDVDDRALAALRRARRDAELRKDRVGFPAPRPTRSWRRRRGRSGPASPSRRGPAPG